MTRASEAGGEFTSRSRWEPRVREDAHARIWIGKGMEYARTHTRKRETFMIPRERRIVMFECVRGMV